MIAEEDVLLSTAEAGELLGLSGATVGRMLDAGAIPCAEPGSGAGELRSVRLADVFAYKAKMGVETAAAMEDLVADATRDGLYELDVSDYLARFES